MFQLFTKGSRLREAEANMEELQFQVDLLTATLQYGAGQFNRAKRALTDIDAACQGVGSPNGTTRKIHRIAAEALVELSVTYPRDEGSRD